jgi:hypothetical protein
MELCLPRIYVVLFSPINFPTILVVYFPQNICHCIRISQVLHQFCYELCTAIFNQWLLWRVSHHIESIILASCVCLFASQTLFNLLAKPAACTVVVLFTFFGSVRNDGNTQRKKTIYSEETLNILEHTDKHMQTLFLWWNNLDYQYKLRI